MHYDFRRLFAPPVFADDEDKSRAAFFLSITGWSLIIVLTVLFVLRNLAPQEAIRSSVNVVFLALILTNALALYLSHKGYVQEGSLLVLTTGWLALTALAWIAEGVRDVAFSSYLITILGAGLLIGWKGAVGFTVASIASGWVLAYAQASGLLSVTLSSPLNFARDMSGVLVIAFIIVYLLIINLRRALQAARSTAGELLVLNQELSQLRVALEQRVEERTSELGRRASQLETVSNVARTIASVQEIDSLLPAITRLVSEQFDFYHVGIFLVDPLAQRAVLRAANSQGGLRMLSRQHSLSLDTHSIVGYAISHQEARIALEVGRDSVHFENPDLPHTRSEMAVPLRVAGNVIGALDVQSTVTNAFSPDDVSVLMTLADQIAIAIENARLFGEAQRALEESRAMFEKYSQQEWRSFVRQVRPGGFLFDGKHVTPLERSTKREPGDLLDQAGPLSPETPSANLTIPIKLRGQTIGLLDLRAKNGQRSWSQDEIAMLEAAADRAALALENARLVEGAQRRAARERAIGDISSKIGAVSNLESILQTAVEELGRKIGGAAEVSLEIDTLNGHNND